MINEKLKQTILYILCKYPGKQIMGLKKLCKLLYFSDFNYYKKKHESITGAQYLRWEFGPFPKGMYQILEELKKEGKIKTDKVPLQDLKDQINLICTKEEDLSYLSEEERKQIDHVLKKLGDKSGTELQDLSHDDTPWQVTKEDGLIDYDLVFYRDEEVALKVE